MVLLDMKRVICLLLINYIWMYSSNVLDFESDLYSEYTCEFINGDSLVMDMLLKFKTYN